MNTVRKATNGLGAQESTIKMLTWNIYGKGKVDPRREMIRCVIEKIDPDVLLLQEANEITKRQNLERTPFSNSLENHLDKYELEHAEKVEQAIILFKKKTFKKVSPSPVNLDIILKDTFPAEQNRKLKSGTTVLKKIKERICVVHLRHETTGHEFVFVSYHNIRKDEGVGTVKELASNVCKIIANIQESSGRFVIAGVDFNCLRFNPAGAIVLQYDTTPRRREKTNVDFFVLSRYPSSETLVQSVEAYNIFPSGNTEDFYNHFQELLRSYTEEDYKNALDHDPLLLKYVTL